METRKTLLLRPARGADLFESLTAALAAHAVAHAWIEGRGTLDDVEVRDDPSHPTRTFATTSRIVALDGVAHAASSRLSLATTVSRPSLRGPEFLSGEIVRAVAGDLELLVTVLEQPGQPSTREADESQEADDGSQAQVEPPSPWAQVAAASTQASSPAAGAKRPVPPPPAALAPPAAAPIPPRRKVDIDELYPETGDLIDHFAFGRCIVVKSDGDEIMAQDPDTGRTRTLRIQALAVSGPFEEDGKRVFRLTQKRTGG